MSSKSTLRCAVYTRKSTEDGLEQEFNSLEAQREACEAFVASQASLGWKVSKTRYDDGGLSGGTMDRPALQALLEEIRTGRIDIIVVYKIDRLTRSLMDFAKMVEIFDRHEVSFVSVTQQFNTTSSMGRLTLNVLLSFAQFEREVTAERIRDKIAASKKKGMFMGGCVPIGYDARDRKLVINEGEARTIRQIFALYLDLQSVRALKEKLDAEGVLTKRRTSRGGSVTGGKPFSRGNLYQLLKNPIYVGKIAHKGETYVGQHEAIIDNETWDRTQELLTGNAPKRTDDRNRQSLHLLRGILFDETRDRLTPSTNTKNGVRYPYYVSHRLMQSRRKDQDGWRLPAKHLDGLVLSILQEHLSRPARLLQLIPSGSVSAERVPALQSSAQDLMRALESEAPNTRNELIKTFIPKITVSHEALNIEVAPDALLNLLMSDRGAVSHTQLSETQTISVSHQLKRRGVETRIVINGEHKQPRGVDANLIKLIAEATFWMEDLTSGKYGSISELADGLKLDRNEVSRTLPLAYLSPAIVTSILEGSQPADLTANDLKRLTNLPMNWAEQASALGF